MPKKALIGGFDIYNNIRPHAAMALDTPFMWYKQSSRAFPENLPPVEYPRLYDYL